jgi:hypothetical protein
VSKERYVRLKQNLDHPALSGELANHAILPDSPRASAMTPKEVRREVFEIVKRWIAGKAGASTEN